MSFPEIVVVLGSLSLLWFFINMMVPIKRIGVRSRKLAMMFFICTAAVVWGARSKMDIVTSSATPEATVAAAQTSRPSQINQPDVDPQVEMLAFAKDKSRQAIWIAKAQAAVQDRLKDPSSAQFRGAFFHLAKLNGNYAPMSCGEVNSKNGLGGYNGFQRYISAGTPELTYLEEEVADFKAAWKLMCVD